MAFDAGTLKAKLELDKTGFTKGIDASKAESKKFSSVIEANQRQITAMGTAMTVAGGLISAGFKMAADKATEFNRAIANVTTLTTESITNVNALKEKVRELSISAAKDTTDVAGGAYEVASAFGEAALQTSVLDINVRGAAAGMATTKEAIALTSAVTKGFGDTSETAVQHVMDLSFMTVKLGQTNFPELAISIGKVVPLMAAMGGKQEELFAGFATLTGVTGTASEVSSQLSGVIGAMIKPTGEMAAAIKEAGKQHLGLADASIKTIVQEMGLVGALRAIIGTTDGSMVSLGKLIARKEALTAALALTGGQADVFNEKLIAMQSVTGATDEAFKKITDGVNASGFAIEQAKIKMQISMQRIGEIVLPIIASIVNAFSGIFDVIGKVIQKFPIFGETVITLTAAMGGLFLVLGPILIILPKVTAGFVAMKAAMVSTSAAGVVTTTTLGRAAIMMGKIAAIGAAFYIGWKIGEAIRDFLGWNVAMGMSVKVVPQVEAKIRALGKELGVTSEVLTDHARKIYENNEQFVKLPPEIKRTVRELVIAERELDEFARKREEAMGITAKATRTKEWVKEIRELGSSLGVTSGSLAANSKAIFENKQAFDSLALPLQRMVRNFAQIPTLLTPAEAAIQKYGREIGVSSEKIGDHIKALLALKKENIDTWNSLPGMVREALSKYEKNVEDSNAVVTARTQEQTEVLQQIFDAAAERKKQTVLSETDFAIFQMDREREKVLSLMAENQATNEEKKLVEESFQLAIQKIRDAAYKKRKETEKKQKEAEEKEAEALLKKMDEAIQAEEERQQRHNDFLISLKKEQQALILQQIFDRDGWRAGELARIQIWEEEQYQAASNRLDNEIITYLEFQEQKTAIHETAEAKREEIERKHRERQEKEQKDMEDRLWRNFEQKTSQKQQQMQKYFDFATNLNTIYTAIRTASLNSWYDLEYERIMASNLTQEEREAAIEALDTKMHAKKAALEAASAKREKALAIAQAIANTAVAITTALKALPWPFNLPAIAFAIATGAAQIAAIGGAYKSPDLGSFAPGGTTNTGGTGKAGTGTGAGTGPGKTGKGAETPKYQEGTGGFIPAIGDFIVGEPYSPELVQLRGNLQNVAMAVQPLGRQAVEPAGGVVINISIPVTALDAYSFKAKVQAEVIPEIQAAVERGLLSIPRRAIHGG